MWSSDEFASPLNSICQEYWHAYSSPPLILGDTISRECDKGETYNSVLEPLKHSRWDEMGNLYRRLPIDASYQVAIIWLSVFRED